jgi:hypothetical protein
MTRPDYGTPQVVHRAPEVTRAPDRIRIPLIMLATLHVPAPDLVYLGHTADGQPVHYRITGWDPTAQALTAERTTR